jgi:hypothetical protein
MLNISSTLAGLLDGAGPLTPVLGLAIDWPEGTQHLFDRAIRYEGIAHSARLAAVEAAELTLGDDAPAGVPRLTVRAELLDIADPLLDLTDLTTRLRSVNLPHLRFRLTVGFVAAGVASGEPPAFVADDFVELGALRLRKATQRERVLLCEFVDELHAAGEARRPCPLFCPHDARAHPFRVAARRRVAWIFGHARGVRLEPWRFGPVTRLTADLHPGAATATIKSFALFPHAGTIQIGGELLTYATIGSAASTLGSAGQPLGRPAPAFHPAGEEVFLVPDEGFGWIVAAHPCAAVSTPRHVGGDMAEGGWSIEAIDLDPGRPATTVVSAPALPTRSAEAAGSALLRLDDEVGVVWQVSPFNTAGNPLGALDGDDATAARLSRLQPRLEFETPSVGLGEAGFGTIRRASIVVRLASTPSWREDSAVWIGATNGDVAIARVLPRPAGSVVDGVPSNIALRTWTIDVTSDAASVAAMLSSGHRLYLVYASAPGDPAIILVTSLGWRLEVARPELLRPETELRADVDGWMGTGGASVVETPARLLASMMTDPATLDLGAGAIDSGAVDDLDALQQLAGRRVARVVRASDTWLELIAELIEQTGMELRHAGDRWLPIATGWPEDMIAPSEAIPAAARFATGAVFEGPADLSPADIARRVVVYYGREEDDPIRYARAAVAEVNDSLGDDESAIASWLPDGQGRLAAAYAIRRLDRQGAARGLLTVEVSWSGLARGWGGDSLRIEGAAEEGSRALGAPICGTSAAGRIVACALLRDRTGVRLSLRDRLAGTVVWEEGAMQLVGYARRGFAFVADGAIVAFLRRDGNLFLAGRKVEGDPLPVSVSSAFGYDAVGARMVMSAPWLDSWMPVLAITAAGDLQTHHPFAEMYADMPPQTDFVSIADGVVRLGNIAGNSLLAIQAPGLGATLRGVIVERAPIAGSI